MLVILFVSSAEFVSTEKRRFLSPRRQARQGKLKITEDEIGMQFVGVMGCGLMKTIYKVILAHELRGETLQALYRA